MNRKNKNKKLCNKKCAFPDYIKIYTKDFFPISYTHAQLDWESANDLQWLSVKVNNKYIE